jgi:predicted RNase H-like HicB family nuclease
VITKGEDGWYVVTVPSLPGCITQGKTIKEAKENIKEAISLYLDPQKRSSLVKEIVSWMSLFETSPLLFRVKM